MYVFKHYAFCIHLLPSLAVVMLNDKITNKICININFSYKCFNCLFYILHVRPADTRFCVQLVSSYATEMCSSSVIVYTCCLFRDFAVLQSIFYMVFLCFYSVWIYILLFV